MQRLRPMGRTHPLLAACACCCTRLTARGAPITLDTADSVLGTVALSQLVAQLCCETIPQDGRLTAVDAKRATDVEGGYTTGDVAVSGSGSDRDSDTGSCGVVSLCTSYFALWQSRDPVMPLSLHVQDGLNQLAVAMGWAMPPLLSPPSTRCSAPRGTLRALRTIRAATLWRSKPTLAG